VETWNGDMAAVRRAVDHLLEGNLAPLLDLLTGDVEFEVAQDDDGPTRRTAWGPTAVADYFNALGGLVAFWQMDYGESASQVIAWGKESFTVAGSELEGGCEFALVFQLDDGKVTGLLVIEDLAAFVRDGGTLVAGGAAGEPVAVRTTENLALTGTGVEE
jgi:ketosteroid isomerase-like protein